MIFVTVGSQKFQFNRLLEKVDQMAGAGAVGEEIIMQTGAGDYFPRNCRYQAFYDRELFMDIEDAPPIPVGFTHLPVPPPPSV